MEIAGSVAAPNACKTVCTSSPFTVYNYAYICTKCSRISNLIGQLQYQVPAGSSMLQLLLCLDLDRGGTPDLLQSLSMHIAALPDPFMGDTEWM